jgi:hypothetical protein
MFLRSYVLKDIQNDVEDFLRGSMNVLKPSSMNGKKILIIKHGFMYLIEDTRNACKDGEVRHVETDALIATFYLFSHPVEFEMDVSDTDPYTIYYVTWMSCNYHLGVIHLKKGTTKHHGLPRLLHVGRFKILQDLRPNGNVYGLVDEFFKSFHFINLQSESESDEKNRINWCPKGEGDSFKLIHTTSNMAFCAKDNQLNISYFLGNADAFYRVKPIVLQSSIVFISYLHREREFILILKNEDDDERLDIYTSKHQELQKTKHNVSIPRNRDHLYCLDQQTTRLYMFYYRGNDDSHILYLQF